MGDGFVHLKELGETLPFVSNSKGASALRAAAGGDGGGQEERVRPETDLWWGEGQEAGVRALGLMRETEVMPYLTEGLVELEVKLTEGTEPQGE